VKPEKNWTFDQDPTINTVSTHRAAAQVRQVSHAQVRGDFPQPGSTRREETARNACPPCPLDLLISSPAQFRRESMDGKFQGGDPCNACP
jgi:hypothetical protein